MFGKMVQNKATKASIHSRQQSRMAPIPSRFLFSERRPSPRASSPRAPDTPQTASTHQTASKALATFGSPSTISRLTSFASTAPSGQFGVGQFGGSFPPQEGSVRTESALGGLCGRPFPSQPQESPAVTRVQSPAPQAQSPAQAENHIGHDSVAAAAPTAQNREDNMFDGDERDDGFEEDGEVLREVSGGNNQLP